jgi:hypothetical protein
MKTAVEWLVEELPHLEAGLLKGIIEQAKEMEKHQIMNANSDGFEDGVTHESDGVMKFKNTLEYYNETYKKK